MPALGLLSGSATAPRARSAFNDQATGAVAARLGAAGNITLAA